MPACTRLETRQLEPASELNRFLAHLDNEGAVVSFVGVARPRSRSGEALAGLFLDHYRGMTEDSLARIADDAVNRFDVGSVLVVHRCGLVDPGEAIVIVAASSQHRRAAFDAADYLMDRLKTEAVFWKRENGENGSAWIEPTEQDRADRARWE